MFESPRARHGSTRPAPDQTKLGAGLAHHGSEQTNEGLRHSSGQDNYADVVKLADTLALGANGETLGGSNPSIRTIRLRILGGKLQDAKAGSPAEASCSLRVLAKAGQRSL